MLASLALGVRSASAHDPLESSTPAADETVSTGLTEVRLIFTNAPLQGAPSAIQVTDPGGVRVDDDRVTTADRSLSVRVAPTAVGVYSVRWQTVSSDAHTISGEYVFRFSGPASSPMIEPAPTGTSPAPSASPSAVESDTATEETAASDEVRPFVPLIVGVVVLVVAAIIAAAVRAARAARAGRSSPAERDGGESR